MLDVVTAISTLKHVDPDRMSLEVCETGRVLRRGGTLFTTMPDCDEAESMHQLLTKGLKVLSHERRILDGRSKNIGVTSLLLTTITD